MKTPLIEPISLEQAYKAMDEFKEISKSCAPSLHHKSALVLQKGKISLSPRSIQVENEFSKLILSSVKGVVGIDVPKLARVKQRLLSLSSELREPLRASGISIDKNLSRPNQLATEMGARTGKFPAKNENGNFVTKREELERLNHPLYSAVAALRQVENALVVLKGLERATKDGVLYMQVHPFHTISGRVGHAMPNISNVPGIDSPFGSDLRSIITPGKDRIIFGMDASSLEARILAHFLAPISTKFRRMVTQGDVHQLIATESGVSRGQAKQLLYALMYGAGNPKLQEITNLCGEDLERTIHSLRNSISGFFELNKSLMQSFEETRRVRSIDGRQLPVEKKHAILNLLLQSSAAYCMKLFAVHLTQRLKNLNCDPHTHWDLLIFAHDEFQISVHPSLINVFEEQARHSLRDVEKELSLQCPLEMRFKVGKNWAETH
jgi:DNA polymerase I-like protein with 3'-5' exonuclease and polymerase domains